MRIVVMGTGPFAVPTFEWLLESRHEVPCLITRPTRAAKGRHAPPVNPMRQVAEKHNLTVHAPESINTPESIALLAEQRAELFVVCDYGQILSREALSQAPLGGINLHASLLPKYRGAAPINWAMLEGETETGVTVIHMTPRLDGGPCLVQERVDIHATETAVEVEQNLALFGVDAIHKAIEMLQQWNGEESIGQIQDQSQATRAPRLSKSHALIDWTRSAEQIRNQLRALQPWPGVYTMWHGRKQPTRLILGWVDCLPQATSAEPGTVIAAGGEQLWVATGDGVIAIRSVQPAGKRLMQTEEFLRGHGVQEGDRLG